MKLTGKIVVLVASLVLVFSGLVLHAGMHGKMKGHHEMGMEVFSGSAFGSHFTGKLVDVKAQMAKMGGKMKSPAGVTHHLMINAEGGLKGDIEATTVITSPTGKVTEVKLAAMGAHIGSDLNLDEKGTYSLRCELIKGSKKESFDFTYDVK